MKFFLHAFVVWLILASTSAFAQDDLIHSDLPLWGSEAENVWPKHFYDESSFGCVQNVMMGDWKYEEHDPEHGWTEEGWYGLNNYGAFHCYLLVQHGYKKNKLKYRDVRYSFLVDLGQIKYEGRTENLWALQLGGRPGSNYMLLASHVTKQPISSFRVLQVWCPRRSVRAGPDLDVLATRYCAINSRRELRRLARKMAKKPPLGRLDFAGAAKSQEEEAE